MANFFLENQDLIFTLNNMELQEVLERKEKNYTESKKYDIAPESYEDALDNFNRVLTVVGEIAAERIAPRAKTVDEEGPKFENGQVIYHPLTLQNLEDLRKAGVMGVLLPREFGGLYFPTSVYTMMTEMISQADGSLQNLFGLQDIAETICRFGSEEQKLKYLPRFACGEADGSMDLTESDSGSDLQSVRLRASQDENGNWFLDGSKRFITNGCAKIHLVLARSEEGTTDGRGLSMFICERNERLTVRRIEHKLGIHGVATTELQYNHVPAELCGKRKFGLIRYVMSLMNGARVAISAQAVGIAEAAYREAKKYASERVQFKQSIDQFPPVYDMLARMKAKLTAARTLLYETTKNVDLRTEYELIMEGEDKSLRTPEIREKAKYYAELTAVLTPMSKALSTESANQICYDGLQIHGGVGYMHDFEAERYYRDVRITNIYEGTTQLQIVAAVGGVLKRSLDKEIAVLFSRIDQDGIVNQLKDAVSAQYQKQLQAVSFIVDKKDPEYHNLRARNLVENETIVFTSLLLLRDACKDAKRIPVAERFILDSQYDFERNYGLIMNNDLSLIEKHRDIIDY